MRIAFTGTRTLTSREMAYVDHAIRSTLRTCDHAITGACIGVDALVARTAHSMGIPVHTVVPADRSRVDPDWRNYCDTFEEMPASKEPYRARNTRMVELADRLVAFAEKHEDEPSQRRSGTWMTVRIARNHWKPIEQHILSEAVVR